MDGLEGNAAFGHEVHTANTYNFSATGAIDNIAISIDAIKNSPIELEFVPLFYVLQLLKDNDLVPGFESYVGPVFEIYNTSWQTITFTDLSASHFVDFDGLHLDFSKSGRPIYFGFSVGLRLGTGWSRTALNIEGSFDNWAPVIEPVPIPGTVWLIGFGLVGFVVVRRNLRE